MTITLPNWAVIIWLSLCLINVLALVYFLTESLLHFGPNPKLLKTKCNWQYLQDYRFCTRCRRFERRSTLFPWRWKSMDPKA